MLKNDLKNDIEKTLQAHCPEPPEGFAERMDNKAISLIQKKHNQNENKGRSRFRLPVLVTAAMLALCFVTAATRDLINRPDEIRARETTTPLVTTLSEGKGEVTEGAGLSQEAIERLETEYPGLINELRPVNLSDEQQGVRFDLVSAVIKNRDFYIVYSIQDLEGDRVKANLSTDYHDYFGANDHPQEIMRLNYDEAEHKGEYVRKYTMPEAIHTTGEVVAMSFQDLWTSEHGSVDLLPLLEQYGKTVKSVALPEDLNIQLYDPRDTSANYSRVLDYTQPLDITLYGPVKLTGIGWIDNKLHVQVYNQDTSVINIGRNSSPSWKIWLGSHITDQEGNRFVDYNTLSWGYSDEKEPVWQEYVWDISPDEKSQMDLSVAVEHVTKTLEAKWEFQVPADSILAGAREDTAAREEKQAGAGLSQEAIEALETNFPGVADKLKPVNLSCEKQGIRMNVISALVEGNESWVVYSLQDLEGDRISRFATVDDDLLGFGDIPGYYCYLEYNQAEHKNIFVHYEEYSEPYNPVDNHFAFRVADIGKEQETKIDLLPFLEKYGKTSDGVKTPDEASVSYNKGLVYSTANMKVLVDSDPLSENLYKDAYLTGIGWIDDQLHVRIQNRQQEKTTIGSLSVSPVCISVAAYIPEKPNEMCGTYQVEWGPDDDGSKDQTEYIIDIRPDEVDKIKLEAWTYDIVDVTRDVWEVQIPADSIMEGADDNPAANIQNESDEQIKATLWAFFSSWVGQNTEYMLDVCADEWKKDRLDPKQAIQKIMGYWGQPGGYIINGISGKDNDTVRTVDLTVQWKTEDGGYSYNRHEIALRLQRVTPAMEAYRIDPIGFNTGIDVETVPGKELLLLTEEEIIRKEVGYQDLSYDDFIPLNLSVEKQGIQMKVVSGCVKGQDLYVLCSFQDLEGRYDGLDMELVQWYRDEFPRMDYSRPYSNYAENKSFWLFHTEQFAQYQAEDGTIALAIDLVKFENDTSVDLIPFLEKYGKESEGVKAPENARSFADGESTEGLKVLDYTNPLDVSLAETATLTGIGWIDNQLHVQMHTGAETIQTKSGTGFSATQVHAYDPISSLSSRVVEWDDSGDWFPEWYDYALDIKPEEVEQRWLVAEVREVKGVVEDNWEIQVPVSMLLKETGKETALPEGEGDETGDAGLSLEAINMLEAEHPGLIDELKPVNLSSEKQGVRFDLHSALIRNHKMYMLYSIQDLEGNRVKDTLTTSYNDNFGAGDKVQSTLKLNYDEAEHKGTYLREYELPESVKASGTVMMSFEDLGVSELFYMDLNPQLEQYGKPVEKVKLPEDLHVSSSNLDFMSDMYTGVLDYTQPLDETLSGPVKLTGIGWIDNKLHVQIYNPEASVTFIGKNVFSSWMISPGVAVTNREGTEDVDYNTLSWGYTEEREPVWQEYAWDIPSDEKEHLNLRIYLTHLTKLLEAKWEFQVPVDSILSETDADIAAQEEEPAEPATLSNEGEVFLEYAYPGLLNELKPVNLSSVQQGIRADVISALIKDQKVYVVYSLQDLEGDRIKENPMIWYSDNLGGVGSETMRLGFSEVNDHKITYLKTYDLSEPVQADGRLVIKLDGVGTEEETTINLLPLLKKYGDTVEGVNKPEDLWVEPYDLRTSTAVASSKYPKILDYKHPLEESLKGAISLTGIGWIDNRLHVQIHNTDETAITIGNTVYPSWMISPSGSIRDGKDSRSYEYDTLLWDSVGKWQAAWQEYAWEITPDQVDHLELGATISHYKKIVDARWELDIPIASILADTEVKPAVQEAETEKTEIARGTLSLEEKIERTIEGYWPGIAKELKPMNLSREKQGIRLDVTSALVKGNVSWFVFTLQDLEGDRINEALRGYLDLYDARSVLDESVISTCWLVDFNQAEHKITYIVRNEYSDPYLLDYKDFAVGIRDICVAQESKLDLLPFIREYGEVLDGTEVPENVRCIHEMIGETKGEESWKVLDYTNPPDVELDKDIYLTGAGWIDDQLHLRLANQNKSTVKVGSKSYIQVMYSVETAVPTTDILFWDINDQTEYIFNIHREEMDEMEVSIHMTEILDVVKDYWEVRIPLEEVLAEDEDTAAQETAAPEV